MLSLALSLTLQGPAGGQLSAGRGAGPHQNRAAPAPWSPASGRQNVGGQPRPWEAPRLGRVPCAGAVEASRQSKERPRVPPRRLNFRQTATFLMQICPVRHLASAGTNSSVLSG